MENIAIKKEPEERSYSDVESGNNLVPRPETTVSMESTSDSLESAMTPRYHRSRYFRRNYSSPECAVCEVCQAEFGGPDLLRLHKLAHFNTASVCYVCDSLICDTNGESLGSKLILHMATHHKAISIPSGNYKPEAERAFVCTICLQRFSSNKILTLHTLKQHNQSELTNFTCKICSMDFVSARALHTHLLGSRHRDMKIKVQSIFMCVDCRAIFPARDSYAMHMMMRAQSESCTPLEECAEAIMKQDNENSSSPRIKEIPNIQRSNSSQSGLDNKSDTEEKPEHVKLENGESKYFKGKFICELCNLQFFHPDTFHMHKKMMHSTDSTTDFQVKVQNGDCQPSNSSQIRSTCATDARSFMAPNTGMCWTCIACGYDFDSCDSLAMHVMDHHSGDLTIPVSTSVNKSEQSKANSTLLAPFINQIMHKPQMKKIFENASITSQQQYFPKMPPLQLLTHHPILRLADPKLLNTPYLEGIGHGTKRTSDEEKDSLNGQASSKQARKEYLCEKCKAIFESKTEFEDHKKICSIFYSKCSFCHVSFHDKDALLQHLKHCNPKSVGTCLNCGQEFKNAIKLLYHTETCEKKGRGPNIQCQKCREIMKSKGEIQDHFSNGLMCHTTCAVKVDNDESESVTSTYSLSQQQAKVDNNCRENSYACKHCLWSSDNATEFVSHMVECQKSKEDTKKSSLSPECTSKNSRFKAEITSNVNSNEIIQNLVQDAVTNKRNKRKLKPGTRIICSGSDLSWQSAESDTSESVPELLNGANTTTTHELVAIPVSPNSLSVCSPTNASEDTNGGTNRLDATGHEHMQGQELLNFILNHSQNLIMCKYCHIVYLDRTMYYLHMGLHNLNNPWQCNLCGKVCANVHEFSSHVIHYR